MKVCKFFLVLTVALLLGCQPDEPRVATDQPNIIYILADDLGYGELGAYGQEKIETPNIDALAREGMTFTRHYSGSPVCAPARYMLMTGKHPGNAYIRSNEEWAERGDIWNYEKMAANPALEGQRPIPDSTVTIAEVLQEAGYKTAAVGKWGLGAPFTEGVPNRQGFDFFFGYNGQRQAHTYYPVYLWRNGQRVALSNELVPPHQDLPEGADPQDPAAYARFHDQPDYAAELMGVEALRFIEEA
uniref:sulfatase-like hydrolase/transferase n=1 Tax=Fodinibius sp. TaxID=1872440 RepID=UPI003565863F